MSREIRDIVRTSADHALADTVGLIALVALLLGALYLPVLF